MKRFRIIALAGVLVISGMTLTPAAYAAEGQAAYRGHSFTTVMRGARLYRQNCAGCHGQLAQGHPQWRQPGPDGRYPAPPLNGSGHAWHHPTIVLMRTIKEGTTKTGGTMPAWGGKLSDREIEAIIAWFQSHWPDELYTSWAEMDAKARIEATTR